HGRAILAGGVVIAALIAALPSDSFILAAGAAAAPIIAARIVRTMGALALEELQGHLAVHAELVAAALGTTPEAVSVVTWERGVDGLASVTLQTSTRRKE